MKYKKVTLSRFSLLWSIVADGEEFLLTEKELFSDEPPIDKELAEWAKKMLRGEGDFKPYTGLFPPVEQS